MTKLDEIYNRWDQLTNWTEARVKIAMEEYGKYCAEQAWRGVMFHIPMPITNKSFTDWWNEFKAKENAKTNLEHGKNDRGTTG